MNLCRRALNKDYINALRPWKRIPMLQEPEFRKNYQEFNVGSEEIMFEEQLKDLEITYKGALIHLHKQVEDTLPPLLHYMEMFINLHKKNELVREKLDNLLAKTGRCCEEEEEDYDE